MPDAVNVNDFEWFGIYDHCRNSRTAFVNTAGIRPPQETYVEGISGWQHDVDSGPINIMNCNTLVITDFTYTGADVTEAYFIVGIGDFPRHIVQQTRAYVVGTQPDTPLSNYAKPSDVMIRLPAGWKTFDVNFLAVYNPKTRTSYGHTTIPPVIVPPCEE